MAGPTSPTKWPEILSQILTEKGAVCEKVTGILMQKTLQSETNYTSRNYKCTWLEFLSSSKSQLTLGVDTIPESQVESFKNTLHR